MNARIQDVFPAWKQDHPFAITMWDFSWLERRWTGGGYDDWSRILDELKERGYDAIRIDAYPHLVSRGAESVWELIPCWNQHSWGAPARIEVQVQPSLNTFIALCREKGLLVGLSTWIRHDTETQWRTILTPRHLAEAWIGTWETIDASLRDTILYIDLCNEWTNSMWSPFFFNEASENSQWFTEKSLSWMREATTLVRDVCGNIPLTFSTDSFADYFAKVDISMLDFVDPHLWLVKSGSDFYDRVGYHYEPFSPVGYENVARFAEKLYRQDEAHWLGLLRNAIGEAARSARAADRFCITTEGWSIVDYKDWPMLDWGWVKEGCAHGVEMALATGQWAGLCTSNFCGPQFRGMWEDIAWHQSLTAKIHAGSVRDS